MNILLTRTRETKNTVRFDAPPPPPPATQDIRPAIDCVYLAKWADRQLGSPVQITLTLAARGSHE